MKLNVELEIDLESGDDDETRHNLAAITTLWGYFVDDLRKRGFTILAESLGIDKNEVKI